MRYKKLFLQKYFQIVITILILAVGLKLILIFKLAAFVVGLSF